MLSHRRYKLPWFSITRSVLLILFAFIFFTAKPAFPHRVSIFAWFEDDTICTESYFQDGTSVINGKIEVFDSAGNSVHKGITDRNGEYSFKIPKIDDLTLVLDAAMGHRATFELKVEELGEVYRKEKSDEAEEKDESETSLIEDSGFDQNVSGISIEDIRKVVEEEVSRQIKPLSRNIAKLLKKKGPSVHDIFAGIGYILGLMGLIMYFKNRRS